MLRGLQCSVPVETQLPPAVMAALAAAVAALGLIWAPCAAKEPDIYLPIQGFARPSAVAVSSEPSRSTDGEPESRSLHERTDTFSSSPDARFSLVELPADRSPITPDKRPHHAIGFRWHGAESWLREHGFDAQTCYLPMVRLHTKVSASFNLSGTLWIYGRCSFK